MDGDGSFFLFSDIEEFIYDILRRNGSIGVVEIDVVDSCLLEDLLIVLRFVQSNYQRNSKLFEDGNVILRRERTVFIMDGNRA